MAVLKQDLGLIYLRKNKSNKDRAGIYLCPQCGDDIIRAHWQNKQKPDQICKSCAMINKSTHGLSGTVLFKRWTGMLNRCYNENSSDYPKYGAKGVIVCRKWRNDFKSFYDWSMSNGFDQALTIDKDILSDKLNVSPKVYSPKTCQWITSEKNTSYMQESIERKAIIQFSIDTHEELNSFNSCEEASLKTKITSSNINRAANGERDSAGGFIWIYKSEFSKGKLPTYTGRKYKTKKVEQLDKNTGELVMIHESAKLAAESLNKKSGSSIISICNNTILPTGKKRKSAFGFKWKWH